MKRVNRYGWIPDLPDHRDHQFFALPKTLKRLPPVVDLRALCPEIYDQGQLGSCTANAIGSAVQFEQIRRDKTRAFVPSRLFVYFNERVMMGTVNEDSGAMIRDGIKSLVNQGVCPEDLWRYDISKFHIKPPVECYYAAKKYQALQYARVQQTEEQLKGCLAEGWPIIFGFSVFSDFESARVAKTGMVNYPTIRESFRGGHAVKIVGYDDKAQRYLIKNSYGIKWGDKGYFTMPYKYVQNPELACDFWKVTLMEDGK